MPKDQNPKTNRGLKIEKYDGIEKYPEELGPVFIEGSMMMVARKNVAQRVSTLEGTQFAKSRGMARVKKEVYAAAKALSDEEDIPYSDAVLTIVNRIKREERERD